MNYKTMLKGALALSLSLIVGSAMAVNTTTADVQKYGATFEPTTSAVAPMNDYAYELGTNVTKYAVTGGNPSGWFGAAEDESKIISANGGQALQLNTDAGTLTNKLESSKAEEINAGIAAAGAYIETEAKFVASDTLDAGVVGGTDDTKFAIYAYADESKSPCTTNLVVYHAYYDGNGDLAYTNEVFDMLVDCDVYTKIRVEMKQMKNPSRQTVNVFSVKIGNSTALTSENTLDAYLDDELDEGIWFLTVEDMNDENAIELSSITFKGTGEVDNLAVGIINKTTTYAIDWTASANVVVSNATAELTNADTNFLADAVLNFYPNVGQITNVFINGAVDPNFSGPADSYTYTVGTADAIVTVLAGEQATPATVFSVASVGNATISGADGVYTITVPDGNGLSSVFVNGAAVDPSLLTDNHDGTYSLDVSSLSGNVNVVVAAKKVRTPIGHKWYENPGVIAINTPENGHWTNPGYGPWHMDLDGDFVAATGWSASGSVPDTNTGVVIYDVDALANENAPTVMRRNHDSSEGAGNWGAAVSVPLNVALTGPTTVGTKAIAYPLNNANPVLGVDAFVIDNDIGIGLYDMKFTADGQYLYGACYKENGAYTKNFVYKFRVLNGLKSSGTNLVLEASYDFGQRVRSMTIGQFANGQLANKDVVYVLLEDKSVRALDTSAASPSATTLVASTSGKYGDMFVSGVAAGTPHLTIADSNNANLYVYSLTADGTAFASATPILSLDTEALTAIGLPAGSKIGNTPCVTEDEETLILGCGSMQLATIQYVTPTYTVSWADSANVVVSNATEEVAGTSGTFEAGTVLTFYPTEGSITNVTLNAVEVESPASPYAYTVTADASQVLVVLAGEEPTPPAPTTYTVSWADSQNVVVSNTTAGAEILINSGEFEAGTVITFYPNPGMVITNVAGEAVGHLNSFPLTVTQDTNIVVIADTVQPIGRIKPDWAAQADTTKFWAWVDANGVADYANTDYTAEYLLNVAPDANVTPALRITSIEVGASATTIKVQATVARGFADLEHINGVLSVATGSSVTALTPKAIPTEITYGSDPYDATITIPAGNGNFFRARVDFVAPETSLVTAE